MFTKCANALNSNKVYVKKWSFNVAAQSTYYQSFSYTVTVTDYTPVGIIGVLLWQARLVPSQIWINPDTLKAAITIIATDKANITAGTITFVILYIKDFTVSSDN